MVAILHPARGHGHRDSWCLQGHRSRIAQRHITLRPLIAFAVGLSLLSVGGYAHAQVTTSQADDVAAAREGLLADAQAASDAGDHLRALDLARRAVSLGSNASLRLFVARQAYAMGLLDEAYGAAALCRSEVRDAGESSLAAACGALLDGLAPRLGRVVVRVDLRANHP